jgi:hypothetical protein
VYKNQERISRLKTRGTGESQQPVGRLTVPKGSSAWVHFVTGHDFNRAAKAAKSTWALQAAEKLRMRLKNPCFVTGHGFSRAVNAPKSSRASAPEGCFHCFYLKTGLFRSLFSP